ncbi:hypothetical protein TPHV1_260031 [Treponema phagedenis]|uniref:Uncharacterized protein n=1 Tax=Treponema phagedenis TaxID=162 RepID=A0A0B7GWW2_TREPH|nr:hypothetical protein TPHV1_260031 [Treponema phagedenis]
MRKSAMAFTRAAEPLGYLNKKLGVNKYEIVFTFFCKWY